MMSPIEQATQKLMAQAYHWRNTIRHSQNWLKPRRTDIYGWKVFLLFLAGILTASVIVAVMATRVSEKSRQQAPVTGASSPAAVGF